MYPTEDCNVSIYSNWSIQMDFYQWKCTVSVHNIFVLEFKEQTEAWNHEDQFDQEFTVPE